MAIRHNRYNAKALVNKGNCLFMSKEYVRAKEIFLEAIGVEVRYVARARLPSKGNLGGNHALWIINYMRVPWNVGISTSGWNSLVEEKVQVPIPPVFCVQAACSGLLECIWKLTDHDTIASSDKNRGLRSFSLCCCIPFQS